MDQSLVVLSVGVAVVLGFWLLRRMGQIPSAQARRLVEAGARLVDVRTPDEFASSHLPGAINVPLQELSVRIKSLGAKQTPVVLYCASGTRSAMAQSILRREGFEKVFNLGSMARW